MHLVADVLDDFPAVLAAAARGDGRAFEALFHWLATPVARYLRSCRVDDPDDLANEVFLRVFRGLSHFEGGAEAFRSWVFTIAHNAASDDRRRAARRPRLVTGPVDDAPGSDAADAALEHLSREQVEALLDRLPPDQRDVYLLRVVADLSVSETAAVLGKNYEAVKALQRRGAARLKLLLTADTEVVPK